MKELMGVLEPVAQSGRSLLIIAEDVATARRCRRSWSTSCAVR